MKHVLMLSLGLAFVATAVPATAHEAIGTAIGTAIERHEPKSWFTPEQKAFIQAKCGVDVDSHHHSLNINGATMTCPDGRTINDPQVRVISEDISRRVNEYTSKVMKQADVQRAIAMSTSEHVRKAIDEAHIERQVQQALAQAEVGRKTAERVREALARSGMSDTH